MTSYDRRHHACRRIIRSLNRSQCSVTLKVHWLNLFAKFSVTERTAVVIFAEINLFMQQCCGHVRGFVVHICNNFNQVSCLCRTLQYQYEICISNSGAWLQLRLNFDSTAIRPLYDRSTTYDDDICFRLVVVSNGSRKTVESWSNRNTFLSAVCYLLQTSSDSLWFICV